METCCTMALALLFSAMMEGCQKSPAFSKCHWTDPVNVAMEKEHMKQIQFQQPGDPAEVAQCVNVPIPELTNVEDVLVKISAFLINTADLLTLQGFYPKNDPMSSTLGNEAVGVVQAVGTKVETLTPGDKVVLFSLDNWSEYKLVHQADVLKISDEFLAARLSSGGTLVVYGAMSGQPISIGPATLVFGDIRLCGFWLTPYLQQLSVHDRKTLYLELETLMRQSKLSFPVTKVYSIDCVNEALEHAQRPSIGGKIFVQLN